MSDSMMDLFRSAIKADWALLRNIGVTINTKEAYRKYKATLPWYRRWFWPWLNDIEKVKAVFNSLKKEDA